MFQRYQESQKTFYETIVHSVLENGKISHAYLIETNGFPDSLDLALSFAKFLICTSHKTEIENCGDCHLCHLIDQRTCADVKVIEPDGLWIKKEQLISLQAEFKMKSVEDHYRIYIINGADRLNKSAANSMLKFLEEPEENIIAILLTPNRYQVLNTIVSRCQLFRLVHSDHEELEINKELIQAVARFCDCIESMGLKTIAYSNQIWGSLLKSKDQLLEALSLVQQYYETLLQMKLNRPTNSIFQDLEESLQKWVDENTLDAIVDKIHVIYKVFEKVDFNANQSLLLDKLVIDLCGGIV